MLLCQKKKQKKQKKLCLKLPLNRKTSNETNVINQKYAYFPP
jgi:hypothetical protein